MGSPGPVLRRWGTLDECKNRCRRFPEALFFSTIADVEDYSDMDRLLETRREHEKITGEIEELLKKEGNQCYTLSSDSCALCEKCTYPKRSWCLIRKICIPVLRATGL